MRKTSRAYSDKLIFILLALVSRVFLSQFGIRKRISELSVPDAVLKVGMFKELSSIIVAQVWSMCTVYCSVFGWNRLRLTPCFRVGIPLACHHSLKDMPKIVIFSLGTCLLLTACEVPVNYEQVLGEYSEESSSIQESSDDQNSGEWWSTYTNEKYGFSINFPSTWSVKEDSHGRPYVYFSSPGRAENQEDDPVMIDARIITYSSSEDLPNNDDGLSFENWIGTEDKYFDGEVTSTTVDGVNAYLIHDTGMAGKTYEFSMVEYEGRIYELNFNVPDSEDYLEEREQMLDSFHFLSSSTNETSSSTSDSCDEETCFVENFKTCESATMSSGLASFATVRYEILEETNGGCEVEMVYTKNPNPAWVDQPIVCTLDMDADFLTAWQKEFEAAMEGEGNCTGPLTEILQDL